MRRPLLHASSLLAFAAVASLFVGRAPEAAAGDSCKLGDVKACESKCAAKDGLSCERGGISYEKGIGTATDAKKGFELFTKGCDLKHQPSCVWKGHDFEFGIGTTKDEDK